MENTNLAHQLNNDTNDTADMEKASTTTPKKKSRHNYYLQTNSSPLQILESTKALREAISSLDRSDIVRVIKGYEKPLRVKTSVSID